MTICNILNLVLDMNPEPKSMIIKGRPCAPRVKIRRSSSRLENFGLNLDAEHDKVITIDVSELAPIWLHLGTNLKWVLSLISISKSRTLMMNVLLRGVYGR